MNELKTRPEELVNHRPQLDRDYDPSETASGSSWLDLRYEDQFINIE